MAEIMAAHADLWIFISGENLVMVKICRMA